MDMCVRLRMRALSENQDKETKVRNHQLISCLTLKFTFLKLQIRKGTYRTDNCDNGCNGHFYDHYFQSQDIEGQ